ncbi:hypothetical protein KP509_18G084900 [Ceratopteris richardii]|uniref:Uncharacterized protein n=1 Tax=Ceratopteris richardii TaxID=49495 RepID=A0A8T2SV97_CERRI|nr:hypothetical protein KP509_18G084900 [Ceratopteris richardii]
MAIMEGRDSKDSYAVNSALQNRNFHTLAQPRLEKAIGHMLAAAGGGGGGGGGRHPLRRLTIADLGCAYGPNTIQCAKSIVQALGRWGISASAEDDEEAGMVKEEDADNGAAGMTTKEVLFIFSDLPRNDFNALFEDLESHFSKDSSPPPVLYVSGVPGSFYGRLFPSSSIDFAICSYSLHWLSQVPKSITDRDSPCWNGEHAWIHKATEATREAYSSQAKEDMQNFIKSRSFELKSGGVLFLLLMTSISNPHEQQLRDDSVWEVFDLAWTALVKEGAIRLEEMELFNLPMYFLSQNEFEDIFAHAPDFRILEMETLKNSVNGHNLTAEQWISLFTSVMKPTVDKYLGAVRSAQLFERVGAIARSRTDSHLQFTHDLTVVSLLRL